uniref:CIDE-N domain-containing protein n=1 Tax=Hucho hucho TaxID=62062 RepID=A0A4W5QMG7_9TELE
PEYIFINDVTRVNKTVNDEHDVNTKPSASMTQQLLVRSRRPKPFRVTGADRSVKKGIMADGLRDLLNKDALLRNRKLILDLILDWRSETCKCIHTLGMDTEEFFLTLQDNTVLMVLEKGEKWAPAQVEHSSQNNYPQDFIGCLNVKATLYGIYSVSYDVRFYAAKKMLK